MKSRLWTLVALAFLGVCTLAALAMASNRVNQAALTTLYERDVTHLVKLQRIENLLLEVRFRAAGVLLEQLPVQGSLNHVKEVRGDLKTLWQGLETASAGDGADAESVQALADAQKGWPLVDATLGKVEKALSAKDNAALTQVLEDDWPVLHKGFVKPVQVLIPRTREAAQRGYESATSKSHFMLNAGLLAACVCLVVLAVVAGLTVRSLLRPLRELEGAIRHMADGDLATPVPTGRQDEVGHMSLALAEMQARLRHLVSDVKHSTENITTASQEVAAGSQDLSQRTEQAAAHLQTTASSMVQLTSAVSQSAGAAQEANQLAQSAAKVAQRGGVVVADVVSTMSDISASSKRIADIIGVIDGIAFQTNILALNAAVEAARAGEQGRGFAVVASEVRGLAQRSAAAAKEIKGLIVSSVEKVESGGRLVSDAGATMAEIVASVQRVTEVIGLISASTAEQSSGIGQVNGSVAQLDNTTQQNAALVEQSAAAAESLQEQALRLTALVGTFRLAHSSVS